MSVPMKCESGKGWERKSKEGKWIVWERQRRRGGREGLGSSEREMSEREGGGGRGGER